MKNKPYEIKLNTDIPKTIQSKGYMVNYKFRDKAFQEIKRLLDLGIIEQSEGKYSSPEFFINKTNDEARMVIDFREFNEFIIDEVLCIPLIYEELQLMGGNKYFSTIDMRNGFNQISLEEESKKFTGFVAMNRHYHYNRVPFGLKSGPKIF